MPDYHNDKTRAMQAQRRAAFSEGEDLDKQLTELLWEIDMSTDLTSDEREAKEEEADEALQRLRYLRFQVSSLANSIVDEQAREKTRQKQAAIIGRPALFSRADKAQQLRDHRSRLGHAVRQHFERKRARISGERARIQ